jgi:hypothetical protein
MHLGHDRLTGEPLFFEAAMGGLTKARLDRRRLGSGRFEPPGCRLSVG